MDVWYENWDSSSWGERKLPNWLDWYQPTCWWSTFTWLTTSRRYSVKSCHSAHLAQPPHHGQLEVLVVDRLVRAAGEGEAVGDLQLGVGHQPQQRALGDAAAASAGLQLVTVLDQLHDNQAVNLDNLRGGDIFR